MINSLFKRALAGVSLAMILPAAIPAAVAAEGGMGVYLLGIAGPQAGYLPEPGTYGKYDHYQYEAWSRAAQSLSASRETVLTRPGPGSGHVTLKTTVDADIQSKTSLEISADIFTAMHVFDADVLGGHPAVGVIVPSIDVDMDIDASVDTSAEVTLSTPQGQHTLLTRSASHDGSVALGTENMGDAIASGLVGWHEGRYHYTAGVNVYVPTGEYHVGEVLNAGRNYWAVEPNAAFTYLNEQNGREFSAALGWTFNDENPATDYDTGDELHLEWAAIQHLSKYAYVGVAGYAYHQTTGDSGSGAALGAFKGEVMGVGPVLGATIPLGADHNLMLGARYYDEFDAKNRMEGDALFVTAVINF